MRADLETDLTAAFAARAATTTTSDDAWARINRRNARRDHRRSVVVKSAAAAAIAVLVTGAGFVLLRDDDRNATVATGSSASKSAADSSASSPEAAAGRAAPTAPTAPTVESSASHAVVLFGGLRLDLSNAAVWNMHTPARIRATTADGVVLGVVPLQTTTVSISPTAGPVELFDDPSLTSGRIFLARGAPRNVTVLTIEAHDASGRLVGRGEVTGG